MGAPRIGQLLIGAAALAAAALPAFADDGKAVTTGKDSGAIRATASGNVVLDYVWRSREITAFTASVSNPTGGGAPLTSEAENTFEGFAAIRLDVELGDKVTAVMEFGSRRQEGDPPAAGAGIQRWGEGVAPAILVREARLVFLDMIPGLRVEAGFTTWSFDVRGKGSTIGFSPRSAQIFTRNLDSDGLLVGRDDANFRMAEAAGVDPLDATGVTFGYRLDPLTIELVLLPSVAEGGGLNDDSSMYAVDIWLPIEALSKDSRVGLIFAINKERTSTVVGGVSSGDNNAHAQLYTVGGGTSLKVMEGLEVFGEVYIQFGKSGEQAAGQNIKAKANAFQAGVEWHYMVGNPLPFWFNATYFLISGDNDTDPNDTKSGKFASYENVADLMILEDQIYGYDWDSNYTGFKISGGASFTLQAENDLDVKAIVGITRTAEDVNSPAGGTVKKLGNEVDLRATWNLNKQFSVKLAIAYLWGSDVLEAAMGGSAVPQAEDNARLMVLGFDLKF